MEKKGPNTKAKQTKLLKMMPKRQTDKQMSRQTDRETDRRTDRQTERHADRQTDRQRNRQTNRQTDRETDRQTGRPTDRHPERQTVQTFLLIQLTVITTSCTLESGFFKPLREKKNWFEKSGSLRNQG